MSAISARSSRTALKAAWIAALLALGAGLLAGAVAGFEPAKRILYNGTLSMPHGFYRLQPVISPDALHRHDVVLYRVPPSMIPLVNARHYLDPAVPLLKPLTALPGDLVCTAGRFIRVRTQRLGPIRAHDSAGRPLPLHAFCGRVPTGLFYSFSHDPRSFDSRHFGPVPLTAILARATPLWTW